jgi:hypothetical protein
MASARMALVDVPTWPVLPKFPNDGGMLVDSGGPAAGGAPHTGLLLVLVPVAVEPLYRTAPCVDVPRPVPVEGGPQTMLDTVETLVLVLVVVSDEP